MQLLEIKLYLFLEVFDILVRGNLLRAAQSHLENLRLISLSRFLRLNPTCTRYNDMINVRLLSGLHRSSGLQFDRVHRLIGTNDPFNRLSPHEALLRALLIKCSDAFLL